MDEEPIARNSMFYEVGLACLAVVSVSVGIYDFLEPRTRSGFIWLDWLDLSIVAVFIIDFIVEARRRGSVRTYAKENWWEIPSLIPITGAMVVGVQGFSIVRVLRLVRLVRFLRIIRVIGVAARLRNTFAFALRIGKRAGIVKLLGFAVVIVALGSVAAYFAERHVDSRLARFEDALWWSLNMFSNVAYVDFQPATAAGRVIAGILEFFGIAFIGVFAGSIANALVREKPEGEARGPISAPERGKGSPP